MAVMLRAICSVGVALTSVVLTWQTAEAQQTGISSLYVATGVGPASFVGRYSSRAKCIEAANTARREVITVNGSSHQPQTAVVMFCVPGGS
jgi:hypothetical protein